MDNDGMPMEGMVGIGGYPFGFMEGTCHGRAPDDRLCRTHRGAEGGSYIQI